MASVNVESINWDRIEIENIPIPGIEFRIILINNDRNRAHYENYRLLMSRIELCLNMYLVISPSFALDNNDFSSRIEIRPQLFFPKDIVESIERLRVDDIPFDINIEGLVSYTHGEGREVILDTFSIRKPLPISQKQWTDLLKNFGYHESWLIEMPRPKVEGFDTVKEHLDKAGGAISSHHSEQAVVECRAALKALEPLIKSQLDEMKIEIDKNSTREEEEPQKSSRIKSLENAILKWAHIGAHPEFYAIKPEDALLCYRSTVALVSYYGFIQKKISD